MSAFYKNWAAIAALPNPHLKMLAATADDETLAKLALGWPELVTETKPDNDGPWPLSVLRRVAADKLASPDPDVFEGMTEFGLPNIQVGGTKCNSFEKDDASWLKLTDMEAQAIANLLPVPEAFPFRLDRVTVGGADYYVGIADDGLHDGGSDAHTYVWAELFPVECVIVDE